MAELVVQIQPDRLAAFKESAVEQLCATPAFTTLVRGCNVTQGQDVGRYVNVHFTTDALKDFWPVLRRQLVHLGLQACSIVTSTGEDGWNDYLLLHHFDPTQARESVSAL